MQLNSGGIHSRFLPSPVNRMGVGFVRFSLLEAKRESAAGNRRSGPLEILAWYPAERETGSVAKTYLAGRLLRDLSFLRFSFGRKYSREVIASIKTNSVEGAPVSDSRERYPVLIFSHDLGMLPEYYTSLMEHLASEGYFVFAPNYAHVSEAYTFAGEKKKPNVVRFSNWTAARWAVQLFRARKRLVGKSYEEKWMRSKSLLSMGRMFDPVYSRMKADRTFLLDFAETLGASLYNQEYPFRLFARRLDISQIGVIGHGWGGASSVDSLIQDSRIKACVNLDGLQFGLAGNSVIDKPLLMIYSQTLSGINEGIYFSSSEYNEHTVEDSRHHSFSDWPFLRKKLTMDVHVLFETANLVIHFFDRHLKKVNYRSLLRAHQSL